jgi:predicted DNA-binding ribbon-helix-helix protein
MCQLFVGTNPTVYESQTRSVRLDGLSTSIRLERAFWNVLDEIATIEGRTTPQFVATLHAEVIELRGTLPRCCAAPAPLERDIVRSGVSGIVTRRPDLGLLTQCRL